MDSANQVCNHLSLFRIEDIPQHTMNNAKKFLLDAAGVILAGSSAPGCFPAMKKIEYWGGRKESTILVYGGKVPAYHAAFINGMFCHAREPDDGHEEGSIHTFASVLPAALAVAEEKGGVSGKEFLASLVLGVDLACRMALSLRYWRGWHITGICGGFGAVAAAGRLLHLDPEKMKNALGILYGQTAGVGIVSSEPSMMKRMNPAIASRSGVTAAYLAQEGITGPHDIFDSKEGFFAVYDGTHHDEQALRFKLDGSLYSRESLTEAPGRRFESDNLYMKAFPSCRFTQAPVQATLNLLKRVEIAPEKVEKVKVYVCKRAMKFGKAFDPGENPEIAAQFSIPYLVAASLVRKRLFLDSLEKEAVCDPRVLELAEKIQVIHDPAIKLKVPVTVQIQMKDGTQHSERVEQIKGNPAFPLNFDEIKEKFFLCAGYSGRPFSGTALDGLTGMIDHLDELNDVRSLAEKMVAC